ncbi:hypothetical protein CEXT_336931 [Caerostris extrusa]|uniref:Uncharacterized protein n=1 Tax=Caerostris extrusa TaxID=172846 RepID=A0AAV4SSX3_CAEEX|nr:hypothetical protein CEXT_336931 [Caerostris extrusa]
MLFDKTISSCDNMFFPEASGRPSEMVSAAIRDITPTPTSNSITAPQTSARSIRVYGRKNVSSEIRFAVSGKFCPRFISVNVVAARRMCSNFLIRFK